MTQILSIHSFRGGTGKSNLSANLAALLALGGKRVAVFDTDIASPGVHVPFGLDADSMGRTLNEYLRGECSIQEAAYPVGAKAGITGGLAKLTGAPLWLVPSSIKGSEISRILKEGYEIDRLNEGMQTLRKQMELDFLIIDTHPGLQEETLLSLAVSDIVLLILRPDQQDFQGTGVTVDIALDLDVPELYLVVNKLLTKYNRETIRQQVADRYGVPVAGVLPMSEDLMDLGSQDIFSLLHPEHPWSTAVGEIAAAVLKSAGE